MTDDVLSQDPGRTAPLDGGVLSHDTESDYDGHAAEHGVSDREYVVIALILAVITAAEVTLTYVDVGPLFLPALLIMMAAKFIVVVSYFMHLKFDNKLFSFLFYLGLLLAVGVYAAALTTFHFFGN